MYKHALSTALVVLGVAAASAMVVAVRLDPHPAPKASPRVAGLQPTSRARSSRPDAADWETIKVAAHLRKTALRPRRTAYYRAIAAYMGLSGLVRLHPIMRGQCSVAVSYLYNNLLDLHHAYAGEDWTPLRQAVATQPSLQSCSPGRASPRPS